MSYKLQSIIFNKHINSLPFVYDWIDKTGYEIMKIDETKNYYRVRQLDPRKIEQLGYTNYHNRLIDPELQIYFVLAYKDV